MRQWPSCRRRCPPTRTNPTAQGLLGRPPRHKRMLRTPRCSFPPVCQARARMDVLGSGAGAAVAAAAAAALAVAAARLDLGCRRGTPRERWPNSWLARQPRWRGCCTTTCCRSSGATAAAETAVIAAVAAAVMVAAVRGAVRGAAEVGSAGVFDWRRPARPPCPSHPHRYRRRHTQSSLRSRHTCSILSW